MSIEANMEAIIQKEQHNFEFLEQDFMVENKLALKEKYAKLLNHIDGVTHGCRKLAKRLIEEAQSNDDFLLAHKLIIAGQQHDLSKLYAEEWEYLCDYEKYKGTKQLTEAVHKHVSNNFHHPEAWRHKEGIHSMSDECLAELVVDWVQRGIEFNRPMSRFLEEVAFAKYNFDRDSKVFKKMSRFYQLLIGENL